MDVAAEGVTDTPLIDHCYDMKFTKNPLSPDNLRTMHRLRKLIKENGYDMVCSNATLAGAAVRLAVMGMKHRPYMIHISHGYMFSETDKRYLWVEKLLAGVTDSLVVMNEEDRELAEKYRFGKSLHYINGMGLDGGKFPPLSEEERREFRRQLGVSDEDMLLLCVGEFCRRKNQKAVIRAMDTVAKRHRNLRLCFAGKGQMLEECRQLVHELELDGYVRFLGQVREMNSLYRCSDLLVTASKMEGLPFNVMEALYCGVPVVASDIKGHRDLIQNGYNGLLSEDITAALEEILSDRERYRTLKEHAFLEEKYLLEQAKPALLTIWDGEEVTV